MILSSRLRALRDLLRSRPEEIEAEIAEEIAFHLAQRTSELEAQGSTPEDARRRAVEMFGNVHQTAAECKRIRIGGILMLQKIQWGVIAALISVLLFLGYHAQIRHRALTEEMRARIAESEAYAHLLEETNETRTDREDLVERCAELERQVTELQAQLEAEHNR